MAPGLADGLPARGDPRAPTTSSSTRSSTSRSSWCAPTTWACGPSRTPAGTAASGSSRAGGRCESGFTCPFHGWCYGLDGTNTFVSKAKTFAEHNLRPEDLDLTPVRCESVGRMRVDQPRRRRAAVAGVHRALRHHPRRLEGGVAAHRVVVRVPSPRELEARRRGVRGAVPRGGDPPQLVIPGRYPPRDRGAFDPRAFIDAEIQYLRTMSEGMAGMVHANDVRIAEGLRDIELPADPAAGHGDLEPHPQRRGRALAPGARAVTSPTSTSSTSRGSTSRWATASRTTSCCPCTAAPPPTASARWVPRRR